MAFITGTDVVDWDDSPRIIRIPSPIVEVSIQDLHDTISTITTGILNLDRLNLISSTGKEDLGGGVAVGITLVLLDACIQFESRGGPSFILCTIRGGNLVAVDAVGAPFEPIAASDFVTASYAQSSSATSVAAANNPNKECHIGVAYDDDVLVVRITAFLVRGATVVASPISASIIWYNQDGTTLFGPTVMTGPDAQGTFLLTTSQVLVNNQAYYADITITDNSGTVTTRRLVPTVA